MNDLKRPEEVDPPYLYPGYRSTALRSPKQPLVALPAGALDIPYARVEPSFVKEGDNDLTIRGKSAPLGERMILTGRLVDEDGRPIRNSLVEIWQANASGRYHHEGDQHDAPLDPHFIGRGRTFTDDEGRYRFMTIKPGSYPWPNHRNAWRPQHIHFSLLGNAPIQRLVTQMYFPGDPLLALDPIYLSIPEHARERLMSRLDLDVGVENYALGYQFDIVLRGSKATPLGT
jgi:protocatechuate 3,4-dioxygenase beta subunit